MLLLTRAWGTSDEYITALEWDISAPLNWYSHAILKNSMFSNTSALFVELELARHLPIPRTYKKQLKEETRQQQFSPKERSEGEGESRKKKRNQDRNTHIAPSTIRINFNTCA